MSHTVTAAMRSGMRGAVALAFVLGLSAPCAALAQPLAPSAGGQAPGCPAPGQEPGIGHEPRFTDSNVALYAGGDYTADGGTAEAEGLLVVAGNATFAKTSGGVFNIGRVGAGSGILPPSGAVMLAVGGDVKIAKGTTVDVGHGLTAGPRYGGSVAVGGAIDEKGSLETNGGSRTAGMGARAALSPYDSFGDTIRRESASLGALKSTGTTTRSGETVTFKGAGGKAAGPQVFEIAAKELDGASTFLFTGIPEGAAVVVNVTGGQAVAVSPLSVGFNGDRADTYDSPRFGEAASRILYNFEGSTSLSLGGGGNFMGSILAPKATADLTASTNGRVYVGGDIRTHGTGNESHNYPWTGSSTFTCRPTPKAPETPGEVPSTPPGGAKPSATPTPTATSTSTAPPAPAPTTTRPGEETTPPATPGTSEAPPTGGGTGDGSLATTGGEVGSYLVAAAALGAAGGAVLLVTRRRRAQG
ncbi:choice-of-anchor A family protein [Streptomyces sp. NPDC048659]|uniref:choice-of-anchor A family protein n=1 Tax=Streptomyces sp. NPDC048659 TaxID=3155489 RepID=UPI003432D74A